MSSGVAKHGRDRWLEALNLHCLLYVRDDIKREVEALGVILVYIHYADDIEKSDTYGSSDPYVTVSFSRYGRALYSTRVIVDDLHPRWEESTAIVLRPEVVKSGERVAVELWDSDRFSADDMLGRAEVDLYQLLRQPGEMSRRLDDLSGSTPGSKRRGRVSWSVGFQPKAPLNEKLRTEGDDPFLPSELKDSGKYREEESAKDRKKQQDRTKRMVPTQYIRPDPEMPSGILSIQVHQISGLDVPKPKSRYIPRHPFQPGKNIDEPVGDETEDAPSSYVEVIVDDRLVYKTRVKMLCEYEELLDCRTHSC